MKNATKSPIVAMAVLAIAAGVASAQSLQADIPFTFRAGDQTMPAGTYRVYLTGNFNEIVVLQNFDSSRTIVLLPKGARQAPAAWTREGHPKLTFECTTRCALTQLWTGSEDPVLTIPHTALGKDVQVALAQVRLIRP